MNNDTLWFTLNRAALIVNVISGIQIYDYREHKFDEEFFNNVDLKYSEFMINMIRNDILHNMRYNILDDQGHFGSSTTYNNFDSGHICIIGYGQFYFLTWKIKGPYVYAKNHISFI